jgi:hypothetical protein
MSRKCLSIEAVVDRFDDPSKIVLLTDGGAGAEKVRSFDEQLDGNYYTRCSRNARRCLRRYDKSLVEVFNLVVKNGRFRGESIAELMASRHLKKQPAINRYWDHLKKISLFFEAQ